ncbi:MAG: class I adenylate-forming enzyme family protein [Candidatus Woesearchaeota archaeon]
MDYKNVNEFFNKQAERYGNKTYLIFDKTGEEFSYKRFIEKVNQTANLLRSIGVKRGDTISSYIPNLPHSLFLLFAAGKLGAIINPMSTSLTKEEVEFQLDNADTKVFIYHSEFHDKIGDVKGPVLETNIVIGKIKKNILNFDEKMDKQSKKFEDVENVDIKDKWVMIYTSGTTGKPKGCLLSQFNIESMHPAYIKACEFTEKDVSLAVMPLIHVTGLFMVSLTSFVVGGTTVLTEKFSKSKFWKWIEKYKVSFVQVVPTMISILLNPPEDISKYNVSSMRVFACGSAPLPMELAKKFEETFRILIYEVYGLTETSHITHYNPPHPDKRRLGSVGKPLDVNIAKVVDENGNEVSLGKVGEIIVKGPNMMDGYHKRPDANKESFKNRWFYTGDLGYKDKDDFYYLVDRKKEIIIRGGENISPSEVDGVIYKHPAVYDAATIGVPHEVYGEEVVSYIVLKKGKKIKEKEIINHCKEHLADFKCPKEVFFVDNIPKGPSGKLLRKELVKMYNGNN